MIRVGDKIRIRVTTRNFDGEPADPLSLEFRITQPGVEDIRYVLGSNTEIVRSDTGVYFVFHLCQTTGRHRVAVQSSLTTQEAFFFVRAPSA